MLSVILLNVNTTSENICVGPQNDPIIKMLSVISLNLNTTTENIIYVWAREMINLATLLVVTSDWTSLPRYEGESYVQAPKHPCFNNRLSVIDIQDCRVIFPARSPFPMLHLCSDRVDRSDLGVVGIVIIYIFRSFEFVGTIPHFLFLSFC